MVSLKKYPNGFEFLEILNNSSRAKIALQGGHIYEFTLTNQEPLLWLSKASAFKLGQSIRGGIPICWPWFGMHPSNKGFPQHGFARTALWTHKQTIEHQDSTKVILELKSSPISKKYFDYDFELTLIFILSDTLEIELITKNTDKKPFVISEALHTYFQISDTKNISITGLTNKTYFDALDAQEKKQSCEITINQEVDRVFQNTTDTLQLHDKERSISIQREGSKSVIVWNPWIQKCAGMSAMNEDSYKTFVCIESANAMSDAFILKSGESHSLKTSIKP